MKTYTYLLTLFLVITWADSLGQVEEISNRTFTFKNHSEKASIPYSSNYSIQKKNKSIKEVIIVIHGTNRNANKYFNTLKKAAQLNKTPLDSLLIIAPQFIIDKDKKKHRLEDHYLTWSRGGWHKGSLSSKEKKNNTKHRVSAYSVMDSLLTHIIDQYPNLNGITLTGHSAGGQFTHRYALSSKVLGNINHHSNIQLRCIVANPSSYTYLNNERPSQEGFVPVTDSTECIKFNEWKHGLSDLYNYHQDRLPKEMIDSYKGFTLYYLIGELDNNPNHKHLEQSCGAMLQGANRLERAINYYNYLVHFYGEEIKENQHFFIIPNVGHSSKGIYHSSTGLSLLFPKDKT